MAGDDDAATMTVVTLSKFGHDCIIRTIKHFRDTTTDLISEQPTDHMNVVIADEVIDSEQDDGDADTIWHRGGSDWNERSAST